MNTPIKIKITERALLARINRKLAKDESTLRKARENSHWLSTTGDYYEVDWRTNAITRTNVGLEKYAKDLGVLKPYEVLAD
jgi:hypothetical protein